MRSNLTCWQQLQASGYFDSPTYRDRPDFGDFEIRAIEQFTPLRDDMTVVVIGCGYGRETEYISPRVKHVYGIDVSEPLLESARQNLEAKGVRNFTPVLASEYASKIPPGVDLVFSIVVMQHLTRDLVVDYFCRLGALLAPGGQMVVQFVEEIGKDVRNDAELRVYEPMVNWTPQQIVRLTRLASLKFEETRTVLIAEDALWHWAFVSKEAGREAQDAAEIDVPSWPEVTHVPVTAGGMSMRSAAKRLLKRVSGRS